LYRIEFPPKYLFLYLGVQMATVDEPVADGFEDEVEESGHKMLMFNVIPSWMISFVGHVALIVLLAFLVMPKREEITTALEASATSSETVESIDLDMADFEDSEMEISETANSLAPKRWSSKKATWATLERCPVPAVS